MTRQRAALVTGSSRGIGAAIAIRLAADGDRVLINYRTNREAAGTVVARITTGDGQAVAVQADVADTDQLRSLFDAAEEHFGRLDVLVSNAGIWRAAPIGQATDEDFDTVFATNARATFLALREAANRLTDGGRIIVISSGATVRPGPGGGIYAASKAAGEQLVRSAARELAPRQITVNSVLPGATRTDMLAGSEEEFAARTALGRLGEPDDIADVVAFLASDAARWITGQAILADGGLL
ncbi:glucose 1-dehydrogenase [Microtetraspora malaysiensis]|uniref:glucose 1-dehydrogenase n=1 Tax=Microtetraspora malaysiensis TaxID=161358 RepID=UPI003D94B48E